MNDARRTTKIRRARREDFESVAGLLRDGDSSDGPSYRWYVKILKDLNHDLHVIEEDGGILGFASVAYYKSARDGGRRAVVECLRCARGALPAAKEKLIQHALEKARKKDCRVIEARAFPEDREILHAFGFREEVASLCCELPSRTGR